MNLRRIAWLSDHSYPAGSGGLEGVIVLQASKIVQETETTFYSGDLALQELGHFCAYMHP